MICCSDCSLPEALRIPAGKTAACELIFPASYDPETLIPELEKVWTRTVLLHFRTGILPDEMNRIRTLFRAFRQEILLEGPEEPDFSVAERVFLQWSRESHHDFAERCFRLKGQGIPVTALFPYMDPVPPELAEDLAAVRRGTVPVECGCSGAFTSAWNGLSDEWKKLFPGTGPFSGEPCFRPVSSCVICETGEVIPCPGVTLSAGSVRERPLSEILLDSHLQKQFRNFRSGVKSPCDSCKEDISCFGCRGRAWHFTGDVFAPDPACNVCSGIREFIAKLPCREPEQYLPHRLPVRMAESLLEYGDNSSVAEALIREDNPFLLPDGSLDPAAFIEIGAQSLAFLDCFTHPGKKLNGMLVEVKNFSCSGRKVFAGERLRVLSRKKSEMEPWHIGSFSVTDQNGNPVAEGELKVCQSSDDASSFFSF